MKISNQYAAGMTDADGSIAISRQKPKKDSIHIRYQPRVTVTNADPRIADAFQEAYGGGFYTQDFSKKNPNHRPVYSWIAISNVACEFLRKVLPFLIVKREQADLVLKLQADIAKHRFTLGSGNWLSPERDRVMAYRETLFQQCRDLKRSSYSLTR